MEKKQGKLEIKAFNTPYYHSWMYTLSDMNFIPNKYAYCPNDGQTLMEHVSYSIIIKKVTLNYNIRDDDLLLDGRKLP